MAKNRQRRPRQRVSRHHVDAIRRRAALRGLSVRQLAAQAQVSCTFLYDLLNGTHAAACSLGDVLQAVGLDPGVPGAVLWLEGRAMAAVQALAERNDADGLRAVVTELERLTAGGGAVELDGAGRSAAG